MVTRAQRRNFDAEARALFPHLPAQIINIYVRNYIKHNQDPGLAIAFTRQDPKYDKWFPGIKRDDGSLRMDENEYTRVMDQYEGELLRHDINPTMFSSQLVDAISNDVSPDELGARISAVSERVLNQEQAMRQVYRQFYGLDLGRHALIAALLDPKVGDDIINRRISTAEVGGAASVAGFKIRRGLANQLLNAGVEQAQARNLFQNAALALPGLSAAAERQSEGPITIADFARSQGLGDPEQTRRLGRAVAGEAASFSEQGAPLTPAGTLSTLTRR